MDSPLEPKIAAIYLILTYMTMTSFFLLLAPSFKIFIFFFFFANFMTTDEFFPIFMPLFRIFIFLFLSWQTYITIAEFSPILMLPFNIFHANFNFILQTFMTIMAEFFPRFCCYLLKRVILKFSNLHDHGWVFHDSSAWSELLEWARGVERSSPPEKNVNFVFEFVRFSLKN